MITENISTLKIQKLTQEQYETALANNTLDNNSIYLTPTMVEDYALKSDLRDKADLVDGKIPLEQLPDNIGSGGGSLTEVDWETNVINKPFYDTRVMSHYSYDKNPNPLSFDNALMNYSFYKISDLVLTKEEIFKTIITINGNKTKQYSQSNVLIETDECIVVRDGSNSGYAFCFCNTVGVCNFTFSGYPLSVTVPETGIYRVHDLGKGMSDCQTIDIYVGGELKPLDPKFIPDMYYDTRVMTHYSQAENPNPVSFDNPMIQYSFYKISDLIPTREQIFGEMKIVNEYGNDITPTESDILLETNEFIVAGNNYTFAFINTAGILDFTYSGYQMALDVPETGIYYIRTLGSAIPSGRIFDITCGGELKHIDDKFIPDTIARKSDLDSVSVDLSGYYTKDEVYSKSEVDTALDNVSVDLSGYYTKNETYSKSELDEILGDIDAIINEINGLIGE